MFKSSSSTTAADTTSPHPVYSKHHNHKNAHKRNLDSTSIIQQRTSASSPPPYRPESPMTLPRRKNTEDDGRGGFCSIRRFVRRAATVPSGTVHHASVAPFVAAIDNWQSHWSSGTPSAPSCADDGTPPFTRHSAAGRRGGSFRRDPCAPLDSCPRLLPSTARSDEWPTWFSFLSAGRRSPKARRGRGWMCNSSSSCPRLAEREDEVHRDATRARVARGERQQPRGHDPAPRARGGRANGASARAGRATAALLSEMPLGSDVRAVLECARLGGWGVCGARGATTTRV